jgi:hypothetical protein
MIDFDVEWHGNYDIAAKFTEAARLLASGNLLREAEQEMGEVAVAIAWHNTPVVTGAWASSWAVFVEDDETFMTIAPTAVNPYSDEDPPQYGPKVHAMGGISQSGHRRDVLNVIVESYGQEIIDVGGNHIITTLRAVM